MLQDMERYSCQVALPDFGADVQLRLKQAKVLIIGMGGLGCPAAQYLVSTGVGVLGIADYDTISISNLHRQVLYGENEVGQKKVSVARNWLQQQNSGIKICVHDIKVTETNIAELIAAYDIVLDATDNFETHYLVNDACVMAGRPLVHGAIYQYEGHLAVWNMPDGQGGYSPNYRDVFPEVNDLQMHNCANGGVMPTIAGIIGCMQANEVIKIITKPADVLCGKLLVFDAKTMQSRIINIGAKTKVQIGKPVQSQNIQLVEKGQLKALLDSRSVLLIDVRSEEEHNAFNIGGKNIPIETVERHIQDFIGSEQLIFYCASGKRSLQVAQWLKEKNPSINVASLEGGIENW